MASTQADRRAGANGSAEIVVDYDTLTIDEMELIEDVCDADLDDIKAGKVRTSRTLRAFALVALRRADPNATLADAGKVDVKGLGGMLGERPPTGAAGPAATSTSASSPRRPGSRSNGSRG